MHIYTLEYAYTQGDGGAIATVRGMAPPLSVERVRAKPPTSLSVERVRAKLASNKHQAATTTKQQQPSNQPTNLANKPGRPPRMPSPRPSKASIMLLAATWRCPHRPAWPIYPVRPLWLKRIAGFPRIRDFACVTRITTWSRTERPIHGA